MNRWRFPLAVAATSLVLVAAIAVGGALFVQNALASSPVGFVSGGWFGPHGPEGRLSQLPPQFQGLASIPASERFAHFTGVQVSLKDKDNNPLTVNVTPGTVTAASADSLTIAANDGSTKTFALNDKTVIHGKSAQGSAQPAQVTPAQDDKVVVVTLNNDTTAMAVMNGGKDGFTGGPGGSHSGWGRWGPQSR